MSSSLTLVGSPIMDVTQYILVQCDYFNTVPASADEFTTVTIDGGSSESQKLPLSILFRLMKYLKNAQALDLTGVCITEDGTEMGYKSVNVEEVEMRDVSFGGAGEAKRGFFSAFPCASLTVIGVDAKTSRINANRAWERHMFTHLHPKCPHCVDTSE